MCGKLEWDVLQHFDKKLACRPRSRHADRHDGASVGLKLGERGPCPRYWTDTGEATVTWVDRDEVGHSGALKVRYIPLDRDGGDLVEYVR